MCFEMMDENSLAMVLNLAAYRFVAIDDVANLVLSLRERLEAVDLRGSVLVAPEGINMFLAGESQALFRKNVEFFAEREGQPQNAGTAEH